MSEEGWGGRESGGQDGRRAVGYLRRLGFCLG